MKKNFFIFRNWDYKFLYFYAKNNLHIKFQINCERKSLETTPKNINLISFLNRIIIFPSHCSISKVVTHDSRE